MQMHKNLHLLEVGRRVLIKDVPDEYGADRPLICAVLYAFTATEKEERYNDSGDKYELRTTYEEGMTQFYCGIDEPSPYSEDINSDNSPWEIAWIHEVCVDVPTKEELLTHRCPQVRQLGLRK